MTEAIKADNLGVLEEVVSSSSEESVQASSSPSEDFEDDKLKDASNQLKAITHALALLSRKINSIQYDLDSNNLNGTVTMEELSEFEIDQELDGLLQSWKLEQTCFPKFYNTCMQLKQNLYLISLEADQVLSDNQTLHQELNDEIRRGTKMRRVIQKLCKENKKLKKQNKNIQGDLKRCKRDKRQLIKSVRDYLSLKQDVRENEVPSSSDVDEVGDKVDLDSNLHETLETLSDSVLDITEETGFNFHVNNEMGHGTFLLTPTHQTEEEHQAISGPELSPVYTEVDINNLPHPYSPDSTSSCKSLVTDEGFATLRLSKAQRSIFSIFKNKNKTSQSLSTPTPSPSSPPIPLSASKFKPLSMFASLSPLSSGKTPSSAVPVSPPTSILPNLLEIEFGMDSPGLQFLRIDNNEPILQNSEEVLVAPDVSVATTNDCSLHDDIVPLFLVCGYMGFKENKYQRPPFGSRLISINNHSLEKEVWSMEDLVSYVKKFNGGSPSSSTSCLKMKFRNDTVSDENMRKLKIVRV